MTADAKRGGPQITSAELLPLAKVVGEILEAQHDSWQQHSYEHATSFDATRAAELLADEPTISLTFLCGILTDRLEACWKFQTAIADLMRGRNLYSAEMSVVVLARTVEEQCGTLYWILQPLCKYGEDNKLELHLEDGRLAETWSRALLAEHSDLKQASTSSKSIRKRFKKRLDGTVTEARKQGYDFKSVVVKRKKNGDLESFSGDAEPLPFDPKLDRSIETVYGIDGGVHDGLFVPSLGQKIKTLESELIPATIGSELNGGSYSVFSTYSHNPVISQMMSSTLAEDENGRERYLLELTEESFAATLMQSMMLNSVSKVVFCLLGWDHEVLTAHNNALFEPMKKVMPDKFPEDETTS